MDWRKYADAIASIESAGSGGYSAIGPRHPSLGRALGRYQIMEANLAPWGQEALGRSVTPDEFLSNPEIQDTLFQHKFGGYVNQYGPEGAAQAWFAGPGGVGKTGRKDSLGTSVGAYTDKFNRAMGGGGSATMTGSAGNDTLGVPMQDEQQPQTFWQRIRERPEMMMAIGGALQNLGWRGSGDDTMRAANAMLLRRSADARAQKQQTRTAQWLAQMGRKDLAEAVASGALDGRSAVALAYQRPDKPGIHSIGGKLVDDNGRVVYDSGTGGLDANQQLGALNTLRDDARTDMGVYEASRSGFEDIQVAFNNPAKVSDHVLAVTFAKILDPGSVVREGEVAAIAKNSTVIDGLVRQFQAAIDPNTGTLPESVRNEIMTLATKMYNQRADSAADTLAGYRSDARAAGLDESRVYRGQEPYFYEGSPTGGSVRPRARPGAVGGKYTPEQLDAAARELRRRDPARAAEIENMDPQSILRALEDEGLLR